MLRPVQKKADDLKLLRLVWMQREYVCARGRV